MTFSSNDFLNCCTRMSVRLFDIPQTKKISVVSRNVSIYPLGKIDAWLDSPEEFFGAWVTATCIGKLHARRERRAHLNGTMTVLNASLRTNNRVSQDANSV